MSVRDINMARIMACLCQIMKNLPYFSRPLAVQSRRLVRAYIYQYLPNVLTSRNSCECWEDRFSFFLRIKSLQNCFCSSKAQTLCEDLNETKRGPMEVTGLTQWFVASLRDQNGRFERHLLSLDLPCTILKSICWQS